MWEWMFVHTKSPVREHFPGHAVLLATSSHGVCKYNARITGFTCLASLANVYS